MDKDTELGIAIAVNDIRDRLDTLERLLGTGDQKKYAPSNLDELEDSIWELIDGGGQLKFVYHGEDRLVEPKKIATAKHWPYAKKLIAFDIEKQSIRSFTLSEMEFIYY